MLTFGILGVAVVPLSGCQDFSRPGLERCKAAEAAGKVEEAFSECEKASSSSEAGKEAKLNADRLRPLAEKAKAEKTARELEAKKRAAEEAAKAQRERWRALPSKLSKKVRDQGMWDMGRGTTTLAH